MNNEQKPEVSLMKLLTSEHLNDETFFQFHRMILVLVSAAVKAQTLSLPSGLYCEYKGYTILAEKHYKQMQMQNNIANDYVGLQDMYHSYRQETETSYCTLYQLITSAYQQTTLLGEKENLKKLIDSIRQALQAV